MDLINSTLPFFYLRLERAGLCGFCMVLCRIRCQTVVIKTGNEEEVVRQKATFLGVHLQYSVTKIICSQCFLIIQSFKIPLNSAPHGEEEGGKKKRMKFHTHQLQSLNSHITSEPTLITGSSLDDLALRTHIF